MKVIVDLLQKDPITVIALIIAFVSLLLILVLAYYYKKIREQEIIDEVVNLSSKKESKEKKLENNISESTISESSVVSTGTLTTHNAEIIIAQLKEISSQISSLNSYIQELSVLINSLKNLQSLAPNNNLESILIKFVNTLQELDKNLNFIKTQITQNYNDALSEVNKKLDNLVKLLSTILQQ